MGGRGVGVDQSGVPSVSRASEIGRGGAGRKSTASTALPSLSRLIGRDGNILSEGSGVRAKQLRNPSDCNMIVSRQYATPLKVLPTAEDDFSSLDMSLWCATVQLDAWHT